MKHILRQFAGRDASPLIQFIKYAIAGGIATAVHIAVFYTLAWKVFPAIQSTDEIARLFNLRAPALPDLVRARNSVIDNMAAFLVSNTTVYIINVLWVFTPGRHHRALEIAMFFAVSALSIAVGSAIMGYLILNFHLSTTVAFGANIVSSVAINYALRKYVIFKR